MRADTQEFLDTIRPLLAAGDPDKLACEITQRWTAKSLCPLLGDTDADVRRLAAVTLGLVGNRCTVGCLVRALHDGDEQVNQLAEDALWSIWFRSGKCEAAETFQAGVSLIERERFDDAVHHLAEATTIDPEFAEAYNQSGIAHFFAEHWCDAVADCERAVELMPSHFGALSVMGHCYAHKDQLDKALDCYCRALQINPRMPAVSSAVRRLKCQLERMPERSASQALRRE